MTKNHKGRRPTRLWGLFFFPRRAKMSKHTPTPWKMVDKGLVKGKLEFDLYYNAPNGSCCLGAIRVPEEANAAFIVRACNSHDELLEAFKKIADSCEILFKQNGFDFHLSFLKDAIAKAEGGDL